MYHFLVSCVIRKTKFDIQIQDSFMYFFLYYFGDMAEW